MTEMRTISDLHSQRLEIDGIREVLDRAVSDLDKWDIVTDQLIDEIEDQWLLADPKEIAYLAKYGSPDEQAWGAAFIEEWEK